MKPKSSSLRVFAESGDADYSDLDETIDLPVLFLPDNMQDCNDDDAGPLPRTAQLQSAHLIELGESINRNLERIAAALENRQTARKRPATKRKTVAKPKTTATKSKKTAAKAKTTAEKTTATRKKQRKTVAKKTARQS